MRKTEAQKKKHFEHVLAIVNDVSYHPLKIEYREAGRVSLWVAQYDLGSLTLLEAAEVWGLCYHTHAGFKQPEELDIERTDHNPVYLNVSLTVR